MEDKKITEETVEDVKETAEEAVESVEEAMAETSETAEEAAENAEESAAETSETAEETAENAEEAAAETSETAEEAAENAEEAAAETSETAEETAENVEEAAENTETAEESVEGADAEEEAETEEAADATEAQDSAESTLKKSAVKEAPIIKKKKKLDKVNIIVIAVCAVIVIACLAFVGIKLGWFKGKAVGKIKLDDYSTIEVLKDDVDIPDELTDQYIDSILQSKTTTEQVTEGTVEDGDQLNIDFVGKLTETGEAFDNGTASGQTLTIGSGQMIDGFESGLIGAPIGETTTVEVTFPEDYHDETVAGKDATFDITVNYKTVTVVPELTDEFVQDYSKNNLEKQLNSIAELKEYAKDYLYHYYLHQAMLEELMKKETVISYDEEMEAKLIEYSKESLDYYAAMYGTTADQYAAMYGASNAEEYAKQEADYYLDTVMLIDQIIKDKNITWTEEEFKQSVALYMARQGLLNTYTVDEYMEKAGETWRFLYENLEFKSDLAMTALEPNVVFVDKKSDAEEESSGEEIVIDGDEGGEIAIDGDELQESTSNGETESATK
ncbi:MAG: trigger factor [Parasporobacterium sp.]|nr:trigger factor [Parasporobacterium sp.]